MSEESNERDRARETGSTSESDRVYWSSDFQAVPTARSGLSFGCSRASELTRITANEGAERLSIAGRRCAGRTRLSLRAIERLSVTPVLRSPEQFDNGEMPPAFHVLHDQVDA